MEFFKKMVEAKIDDSRGRITMFVMFFFVLVFWLLHYELDFLVA